MRLLFFLLWAVCTAFAGNVTVPFTSVVSMDNPAMDNSVDPTPTYPLDARINRPGIHEVPAKPTLQVVIDKKWSNVGQWCKDPLGDEVRNALYKLCPEKYFKGWSPCKTGAKDYYSVKGIEYAWDDRHWDNGWINIRVTGAHFPDGMATDLRLALIDTAAAFVQSQPDIEKNCKWTRLEDGSAFKTKSHHFCFVSSSFEVATVMGNNAYIVSWKRRTNDINVLVSCAESLAPLNRRSQSSRATTRTHPTTI
ncbi:hypothetical protein K504DRAFT_458716 [Pleomassaria siparia CBS 279.74]|uniref:Ecp2 effector protein domain-containing protein n=1 Tax=Pleomassaria siparia CBS 279.74 TaxID=1314801 RepID=A0A6G1K4H7_9PLEO|nr:hypothetical protein K504DRAFT_458716 [Pleomassaria siparia CBS 279.74]